MFLNVFLSFPDLPDVKIHVSVSLSLCHDFYCHKSNALEIYALVQDFLDLNQIKRRRFSDISVATNTENIERSAPVKCADRF